MGCMGQNGRALLLAVCLAGGGVLAAGCGTSPLGDAATTLRAARQVTIVAPDGRRSPGTAGTVVRPGDEIVTGPGGAAALVTRDRTVYLPAGSALRIGDGTHQSVQHGSAVVDARAGDGETVEVAGYRVAVPGGAATRIDGGVTLRVGTLVGAAAVTAPGGARLRIPALAQVLLGGDSLPAGTTALHLTDDAAEAAAAPALVRDDELLGDLARGLDGSGTATARTVQAAWQTGAGASAQARAAGRDAAGTRISDQVLPVVLARAAGAGPAVVSDYADAVRWRAQGGSWGVIAHRLGIGATRAADELAALQRLPHGGLARVVTAAVAAATRVGTAAAGGHAGSAGAPGPSGSSSSPTRRTGGQGSGSNPTPTPSPSPSGPVQHLVGSVGKTVRKVLKSLPPLPKLPVPIKASLGPIGVKIG